MADGTIKNHAAFIWSMADLLRGDNNKRPEHGKVILPLTVTCQLGQFAEPPGSPIEPVPSTESVHRPHRRPG